MIYPRVDVHELDARGAAANFIANGGGGTAPVPADRRAASVARDAAAPRSWWTFAARVVRNAVVAVAVMALVPIGLVAVRGDHLARALYQSNTNIAARIAAVERVRSFRLPGDASITPMQAGAALNALQPSRVQSSGFETIEPPTRPALVWQETHVSPDMFATARPDLYGGPSSRSILEAAAKGFTPGEREYLYALATAPVWRDFDLVARAPAVDVVGGRFRIPFGPDASPEQRPLPSFKVSRDLAYAAVSRATYHMSLGQRDSAEAVLRSIVSFGFAFIDNGSSMIEELIGGVIVGVGRDALQRFYVIQHDPRASLPALAAPVRTVSASRAGERLSRDDVRRRLLARVEDPAAPLGQRFEGLQALSVVSCTNVRELMFGPRSDVTHVLDRARRTVARYPSERALVDLVSRLPSFTQGFPPLDPIQTLAVSPASVAGVVLHNPRLVTCTRILAGGW